MTRLYNMNELKEAVSDGISKLVKYGENHWLIHQSFSLYSVSPIHVVGDVDALELNDNCKGITAIDEPMIFEDFKLIFHDLVTINDNSCWVPYSEEEVFNLNLSNWSWLQLTTDAFSEVQSIVDDLDPDEKYVMVSSQLSGVEGIATVTFTIGNHSVPVERRLEDFNAIMRTDELKKLLAYEDKTRIRR